MRLRSSSFIRPTTTTILENQLNNLTMDVSHFKKKIIPLSQENVQLKEKYHQFKFEIEDSLQQVIILFDQEDQFKAKVNNVNELCQLIKSIFQKTQQSLLQNQQQIADLILLEQQLKKQIDQMELDHLHQYQQLQQEHAAHLSERELQNIQLREEYSELKEINQQKEEEILTFQLKIDKILLQTKQESQLHIDELKYKIEQKCDEITQIRSQHQIELSKQQFNHEKERKLLKDELEQLQAKVEQKYKKLYLDHQQLIQQQIQSEQQAKILKQQKESLDKQIQTLNLKKQQITDELVENKKNRAKESKQIQDLLQQINTLNMKYELEHKRNLKLQETNALIEQENQNMHKNKNNDIIELKQQIEILNQEILSQKQKEQQSKNEFISQLLIQKVKYEQLMGNQIEIENLTYTMHHQSSQYDDPTFKEIIEDFELQLSQLHSQKDTLQKQLTAVSADLSKINQTLTHQFEIQIREFKQKSKQLLHKQKLDFDSQKQVISQEHSNHIQLLSNQMSYEIDKEQRISKNLQKTIEQMQNNLSEKDSLLDQYLGDIEKLKAESKQMQIIHEQNMQEQQDLMKQFEQHSQDQYSQYVGHQKELQQKIDTLANGNNQLNSQIKDLQQQLKVENLNVNQLKATLEKRQKEIIFQQEMITKLNDKVRQLILDMENAKQTFNIFARQNTQTTRNLEFDYNFKRQQNNSDTKLKKSCNRIKTSPERKLRSISNTKLNSVLKLNN